MSSVIILYAGLAIAMLRVALIHEIVAQRASRQRLEQELHLALTRMLVTNPPHTVTTTQNPDSPASVPAGRSPDSDSAVTSVPRTRRIR
ncbi:MAG: hypothetical protein ACRDQ4_03975 [Pseudonocardiaceae bacterium]